MAETLKSLQLNDKNVIVTSEDIDPNKEYSISVEIKEKKSGPTGAGDTCYIRFNNQN